MRKFLLAAVVSILGCFFVSAQVDSPFEVNAALDEAGGEKILRVSFHIKSDTAYLYQDSISLELPDDNEAVPIDHPEPVIKHDQFLDKEVGIYDHDVDLRYRLKGRVEAALPLTVRYQGCDAELCYLPAEEKFRLGSQPDGQSPVLAAPQQARDGFYIAGRVAGYLAPDEFLAFLDEVESGKGLAGADLAETFEAKGALITVLLILLGGLALNLTPCVLPMIPVNIAIIGAGVRAGSRGRGFALGAVYGAGIAIAYGILGLMVVLTGARFGTLNSSPVFNLAVAVVFLVLSLSMFGVFNIDLTRFSGRIPSGSSGGHAFATAFLLGVIAALLAGACVAPVVISVLLLSLDIYSGGNTIGLFLPFLLGIGMALPWPLAGMGLSFMPKTGRWMERVKYAFGIVILIAAIYYGWLGIDLLKAGSEGSMESIAAVEHGAVAEGEWLTSLDKGFIEAMDSGKPVFIDFWASWCKNCLKMEKTTFKDSEVLDRLDGYVKVKFDASSQDDPDVQAVLERYVTVGLPTYVIVRYGK